MDNNIPLISVIVPVYNTAGFLQRCLDSVLGNTYKNLEVICVNDGSTDNSLSVLKSIAEKDSRIKIIDKQNAGPSAARNDALKIASGDYITFIDSDDWVHDQFFEILLFNLKKSDSDILGCKFLKTDTFDEKFVHYDPDSIEIKDEDISTSEKMRYTTWLIYKSEIVKKYRFPEKIRIAEDIFFNSILTAGELDCGNTVVLKSVDLPLYFYYQRSDSALSTNSHATGQLEAASEFLDHAEKMKTEEAKAFLIERAFKAALLFRYLEMFSDGYKTKKKDANKVLKRAVEMCRQNKVFDFKKKEFYIASVRIPALYRLYRIVTDPTMIAWEKDQKSKK